MEIKIFVLYCITRHLGTVTLKLGRMGTNHVYIHFLYIHEVSVPCRAPIRNGYQKVTGDVKRKFLIIFFIKFKTIYLNIPRVFRIIRAKLVQWFSNIFLYCKNQEELSRFERVWTERREMTPTNRVYLKFFFFTRIGLSKTEKGRLYVFKKDGLQIIKCRIDNSKL